MKRLLFLLLAPIIASAQLTITPDLSLGTASSPLSRYVYFGQDYGIAGVSGGAIKGSIISDPSHSGGHEWKFLTEHSIGFFHLDGTAPVVVQMGGRTDQDDMLYFAARTDPTVGNTASSKLLTFNTEYYSSGVKYSSITLQGKSDTSGNQYLDLSNDTTHGSPHGLSAALNVPAGSASNCSIRFRGTAGLGIWSPAATTLQIQGSNDGTTGSMLFAANVITIQGDTAFRTAYKSGTDTTQLALGLYTYNAGINVQSASNWGFVANSTQIASVLSTGFRLDSGDLSLPKTVTAGGTTGAQTINKPTGRVNFAAAATSLVVTNSLCTANSIIQCTIATNDATAANVKAVAGSGSFTIYLSTGGTGETAVNFTLTN